MSGKTPAEPASDSEPAWRRLGEEIDPIEPAEVAREALLRRILRRTREMVFGPAPAPSGRPGDEGRKQS